MENNLSKIKAEALQNIDKAIFEIKSTNINPDFNRGYAYGMVNAFWRANVITFDEHQYFMEKLKIE